MSNRRFARYEIRQVIQRLRWGEPDRDVACPERVGQDRSPGAPTGPGAGLA